MKILAILLLATSTLAAQTPSQTPGQPPPSKPSAAFTPPTPHTRLPASAVRVARPPASTMPTPLHRISTAQRSAIVNDKPQLHALPEFTVADRNGKALTAHALPPQSGHWLLVYRNQACVSCDRLMNVLAASPSPDLKHGAPYVIVVNGKASDGLERVRANFTALADATWVSDANNQALTALKPRGTPMVYAMDGNSVAFTVPGNLGDPNRVEKLTSAWLASSPKKTSTTSTVAPAASAGAK